MMLNKLLTIESRNSLYLSLNWSIKRAKACFSYVQKNVEFQRVKLLSKSRRYGVYRLNEPWHVRFRISRITVTYYWPCCKDIKAFSTFLNAFRSDAKPIPRNMADFCSKISEAGKRNKPALRYSAALSLSCFYLKSAYQTPSINLLSPSRNESPRQYQSCLRLTSHRPQGPSKVHPLHRPT